MYEHVRALIEDVRGLNKRVSDLEAALFNRSSTDSPLPRKKPGPPKGYKRQPRQVAPNG